MEQKDLIASIQEIEDEASKIVAEAEREAHGIRLAAERQVADLSESGSDRLANQRRDAERLRRSQHQQVFKAARMQSAQEAEQIRNAARGQMQSAVDHLVERSLDVDEHR